jgi:hypothetical protein
MNRLLMVVLLGASSFSFSAQWVSINSSDIDSIQWAQSTNSAAQNEGLYIALKNEIVGEAASYCSRKNFIVVTDAKLADRVYSSVLYAMSTQKQIRLYLDGSGKCAYNGPIATIFTLVP